MFVSIASIYSILSPLTNAFEAVLKFFHNSLGVPWGWAIVLLTVCVRAVLVPLTLKQMGSMARLQKLQPEIKAIQNKYKEDKQRQQQEMMKFYKENNVNPLGSCLPMVAQLPVFVGLYYMLRESLRHDICPGVQKAYQHAYAMHHNIPLSAASGQTTACGPHGGASFLFIGDLTSQAAGLTLVVLIVLYVGSQLGSSLLMSSPTMDKRQRQIMLFMPVIFVLFIIRFPAGLLVYWITTNIWTIGQQYMIKRRIGPTHPAPAAAGAAPAAQAVGTARPSRGRAAAQADSGAQAEDRATSQANGGGSGMGRLVERLSGVKPAEETQKQKQRQAVSTGARPRSGGPPPKSPRKKKKRSGRRR